MRWLIIFRLLLKFLFNKLILLEHLSRDQTIEYSGSLLFIC